MLRRVLLFFFAPIALILLALWLLPGLVDSRKLLEPLLAEVEKNSGVSLRVHGEAQFAILPRPGISLRDISARMPEDASPGIRAAEFRLGLRLLPLLSRRVEVDRFALRQLVVGATGDAQQSPPTLDIQGQFGFAESSGLLTLHGVAATLRGALPEPLELTLSGPVDIRARTAELTVQLQHNDLDGNGSVRGEGEVRYAASESPQVDAKLHLNRFSPALYALAGPEAAAEAGSEGADRQDDKPLPLDTLRAMDTRADLSIDEAVWEGHSIRKLEARLRVVNGSAILARLTGEVHGGKLAMKGNLNANPAIPRINTEGRLSGVDIANLLAAEDIDPLMTGAATLDWKLHGEGLDAQSIRDSLRGPIELNTENAVLTAVGVEQKFCEMVAAVNREQLAATLPASSTLEQLSATVRLKAGKARLQPLKVRLPEIALSGSGELDLASQDFDARFNAKLSPALAGLDPACRVNERLTAIKWPVECTGTLGDEPKDWCTVDSEAILKDLGEKELKRKLQDELEDRYGDDAGALLKGLFGN